MIRDRHDHRLEEWQTLYGRAPIRRYLDQYRLIPHDHATTGDSHRKWYTGYHDHSMTKHGRLPRHTQSR